MAGTPITVFGRGDDVEAVARMVAGALPGSTVELDGSEARVVARPRRRLLRSSSSSQTVVNIGLGNLAGEAGSRQRLGLANFLNTTMTGSGLHLILSMVPDLRLTAAFTSKEQIESEGDDQPILGLAFEAARLVDGFVLDIGR